MLPQLTRTSSELKSSSTPILAIDNTLAGMDASKYRADQPTADPAKLMLSSSQQSYSSGWNPIQPKYESDVRLAPIATGSPAYLQSDSRKPAPSVSLLNRNHSIPEPAKLPSPNYPTPKPPVVPGALSTLAEAAGQITDVPAPPPPPNSLVDILLSNSQSGFNPSTPINARQQDPLQSLSVLIANNIKNANGASLEENIQRAISQAAVELRTNISHQNGSNLVHGQMQHAPNHADVVMTNEGQSDGAEEMDYEEVESKIEYLRGLYKMQKRQKKHKTSGRMCTTCNKILPRACDMNKHIKRHTRPFGCTFHKCNKLFGSKNDWKRHENSQHFQIEMFRCQVVEPLKKYGVCAKVFYARSAFEEHLKDWHKVSGDAFVQEHIQDCRIGRGNQGRFWCGFCKKILVLKEQGVPGWDERFNHIDNHYKENARVDHWVDAETNQTKEEMRLEAEQRKADRHQDEDEDDVSTSSSSSSDQTPSDSVTSPHQESNNPLKRKTPHDESSEPTKEWLYFCVG